MWSFFLFLCHVIKTEQIDCNYAEEKNKRVVDACVLLSATHEILLPGWKKSLGFKLRSPCSPLFRHVLLPGQQRRRHTSRRHGTMRKELATWSSTVIPWEVRAGGSTFDSLDCFRHPRIVGPVRIIRLQKLAYEKQNEKRSCWLASVVESKTQQWDLCKRSTIINKTTDHQKEDAIGE